MSEKKLYAVSLVWLKIEHGTINIGLTHATAVSNSEHEAFGVVYDNNKPEWPSHQLHIKATKEIINDGYVEGQEERKWSEGELQEILGKSFITEDQRKIFAEIINSLT